MCHRAQSNYLEGGEERCQVVMEQARAALAR